MEEEYASIESEVKVSSNADQSGTTARESAERNEGRGDARGGLTFKNVVSFFFSRTEIIGPKPQRYQTPALAELCAAATDRVSRCCLPGSARARSALA